MKNHNGIALIELLIYLSVVVLLSNLLFVYYARTNAMIRSCTHQGLQRMRLYAVLDLIKRTLQQAPGKVSYWHALEPWRIMWRGYDGRFYSFEISDHKLYHIIGTYDPINKHWLKAHKVVLLESTNMVFEHEIVVIGAYKMIHAITICDDQLRSKVILANHARKVSYVQS